MDKACPMCSWATIYCRHHGSTLPCVLLTFPLLAFSIASSTRQAKRGAPHFAKAGVAFAALLRKGTPTVSSVIAELQKTSAFVPRPSVRSRYLVSARPNIPERAGQWLSSLTCVCSDPQSTKDKICI